MNLSAYDNINKVNKKRTWIDVNNKILYSREIEYHKYHSILKRYNPDEQCYNYYIALFDNKSDSDNAVYTNKDNYGRIKINLSSIWNKSNLSQLETDCNIVIDIDTKDVDGIIYKIDV